MEPSFKKLFSDKGIAPEPEDSAELTQARAEFRERYKDHGAAILDGIDRPLTDGRTRAGHCHAPG
jgi:hypothetical protein